MYIAIIKADENRYYIQWSNFLFVKSVKMVYGPARIHIKNIEQLKLIAYAGAGRPSPNINTTTFNEAKEKLKLLIAEEDYAQIRDTTIKHYAKKTNAKVEEKDLVEISSDDEDENRSKDQEGSDNETEKDDSDEEDSKFLGSATKQDLKRKLTSEQPKTKKLPRLSERENDVIRHIEKVCYPKHPFHSMEDLKLLKFVKVYKSYSSSKENLIVITLPNEHKDFENLGTFLLLDENYEKFIEHLNRNYQISTILGIQHYHMTDKQSEELFHEIYTKDSVKKIFKKQMDKVFETYDF